MRPNSTKQPGVRSQAGFTLVEVTIILLVLVIISMIMLSQLGNFNRLARKVKVYEDLGAICATLKKFLHEVTISAVWENPGGGSQAPSGVRIGLLHGPGDPPFDGNSNTFHQVNSPNDPWSQTGDGTTTVKLSVETDAPGLASTAVNFAVDRLENHLQVNDPFGDGSVGITTRYRNTSELASANFFLSWKGPYFDTITPDPWGDRYVANVFGLHSLSNPYEYFTGAVVCFSAGPDEQISTRFNQPMDDPDNSYGWQVGGDDIAVILSAGGPF